MRLFIALALALSACAGTTTGANHPVNVALIRHQIDDRIQSDTHDRSITAMGHVTEQSAVVYTSRKDGGRQEETWVKGPKGWQLDKATAMN